MEENAELLDSMSRVRLLLLDCDGVLTDGRLFYADSGAVMKSFHVRDGQGIANWHAISGVTGIITGRNDPLVEVRAAELNIKFMVSKATDKCLEVERILARSGFGRDETAFVGDDIGDLPAMRMVGLPCAVADAVEEVRNAARLITKLPGGNGAVREIVDMLIRSRK